jgi:hypothetical protein
LRMNFTGCTEASGLRSRRLIFVSSDHPPCGTF